jgi:hypothetical protein
MIGIVKRLLTIVVGYCLASVAAGYMLGLAYLLPALFLRPWRSTGLPDPLLGVMLVLAPLYGSLLVGLVALIPAILVVVYAEASHLRSAAFYGAAGAATAVVCLGTIALIIAFGTGDRQPAPTEGQFDTWSVLTTVLVWGAPAMYVAAAGLLGGLVYWRIAGRKAGAWLRSLKAHTVEC